MFTRALADQLLGAGKIDIPATIGFLFLLLLAYGVLHVIAGALLHPFHRGRYRGEGKWNFGWSLRRGPFVARRIGRRGYISESL
jgi:hypothetical protein